MDTLYQLLSNKKFRVILFYVFMSSLVVAFVFSTYILMANINSINDKYQDARARHERLYDKPAFKYQHDIVESR